MGRSITSISFWDVGIKIKSVESASTLAMFRAGNLEEIAQLMGGSVRLSRFEGQPGHLLIESGPGGTGSYQDVD